MIRSRLADHKLARLALVPAKTTAAPTLATCTPSLSAALAGDTLTITGTGLTGATALYFDSVPVPTFTVVNDTTISAVMPASALGSTRIWVVVVGAGQGGVLAATSIVGPKDLVTNLGIAISANTGVNILTEP